MTVSNTYSSMSLYDLAKKVDEIRSSSKSKNPIFSKDSDIGSVKSEMSLSAASKELCDSAYSLSCMTERDFSDSKSRESAVNSFVNSYNSVVDKLQKSDSVDALKAGMNVINTVKSYSGALSRLGIKMDSSNKLSVDSEKLKKADASSVKAVLSGYNSVSGRISRKAEGIRKAAYNKALTTNFRNQIYGSDRNWYGQQTGIGLFMDYRI